MQGPDARRGVELAFGLALVGLGVLFLVGQTLGISIGRYGWPAFIIAPGLLLFGLMWYFGRDAGFLAIPASIVTATGIVIAVANTFGIWEIWTWAWAFVAPTSVGIGLLIWGAYSDNPQLRRAGSIVLLVGLCLLAAFGFLMEVVLGVGVLGQLGLADVVLPAFIVLVGIALIVSAMRPKV